MADYTGLDKRLQYLFQHADSCKVISGYYYNGQMYKDSAHTELITGSTDCLYIDKSTTTLYLYNGSEYEEVQGGGGGSTVTITPTLATGTKIADYSIDGVSDSLYAPTGGGANALDDLTDVTITTPSDGQALLYDSASGEWINGTIPGGGGGSDGTAGLSVDISLGAGQSITYSRTDLNITRKGCYLFSITSGHNAWMEYFGYFFYGGHYPGYTVSGIFSIRSSYLTVSYSDGQNGTFTIKNTSSYGENQRIEILPLHPKIDVDTDVVSGYYNNGDFYEDQSYTQIITGSSDHLYIDLDTTTLYLFDGTNYVEVKGGGGGSFVCDLLFEQANFTPTSGTSNVQRTLTLLHSIDDYDTLVVVGRIAVNDGSLTYREQAVTQIVTRSDYYLRGEGEQTAFYNVVQAFTLSMSSGGDTIKCNYGFYDDTTLYTFSVRSSSNLEAYVYKVYGVNLGGVDSLSELSDVAITAPSGGQMLSFDSSSNKWKNTNVPNSVVNGYYHDGDFYEDQSYTQMITGQQGYLYVDLNTTTLYLYDGSDYVEVQGGGSGGVSDGTVGVRIAVNIPASGSVTYSFDDLGITEYGSYWLLVNSKHAESNDGWKWIGFVQYSGYYTSSYVTSYVYPLNSYYVSVTLSETAKTITFTNNNSRWSVDHLIEVLPLHPKIEINYNEVVGILLAGTTSVTLTDIKITTSSTLEFYTDMFGLSPTNVSVSTGSITLTFEVQSVDVNVKVRIS